jgi:hypothetical protein
MLANGFNHKLRLNKAVFRETGTFGQQVRRPLISNVNESHIHHIANVSRGGTIFTPGILAGISGQVLMPTTTPESIIEIPHGWGTSRFRYMLDIIVSENSLSRVRKILIGYTDMKAINMAASFLAPETVLYVNNIVTIRDSWVNGVHQSVVQQNDQLLNGVWDINSHTPNKEVLIRPEDVVRGMGTPSLINEFGSMGIQTTNDWGSTFVNGGLLNNRINNSPASYLSSVINAGIRANDMLAADMTNCSMDQIAVGASSLLLENSIHTDPVLQTLAQMAHSFQTTGGITIGELCCIMPELQLKAQIYQAQNSDFTKITSATDSENWSSMTTETIIASRLTQVVPAIMFESLVARSRFIFTNMTPNGKPTITPNEDGTTQPMVEMSSQAMENAYYLMANRICDEVHPAISDGGHLAYWIDVYCDPMSDIRLNININNYNVPYVAPCFCDHLTSQLVTNNTMALPKMSNDFSNLLNTITLMVEDSKRPTAKTFFGTSTLF